MCVHIFLNMPKVGSNGWRAELRKKLKNTRAGFHSFWFDLQKRWAGNEVSTNFGVANRFQGCRLTVP